MIEQSGTFFRKTVGNITVPTWKTKLLVWMMPAMFLAVALMFLLSSFMWVLNATETTGTVTDVYEWAADETVENGLVLYGPEFEYVWTDGSLTKGALGLSSPDYNFEIGSQHRILFDPEVKGNVRFSGFMFNYLLGTIILSVAAMFGLISLVLWFWIKSIARKRDEKEAQI